MPDTSQSLCAAQPSPGDSNASLCNVHTIQRLCEYDRMGAFARLLGRSCRGLHIPLQQASDAQVYCVWAASKSACSQQQAAQAARAAVWEQPTLAAKPLNNRHDSSTAHDIPDDP